MIFSGMTNILGNYYSGTHTRVCLCLSTLCIWNL